MRNPSSSKNWTPSPMPTIWTTSQRLQAAVKLITALSTKVVDSSQSRECLQQVVRLWMPLETVAVRSFFRRTFNPRHLLLHSLALELLHSHRNNYTIIKTNSNLSSSLESSDNQWAHRVRSSSANSNISNLIRILSNKFAKQPLMTFSSLRSSSFRITYRKPLTTLIELVYKASSCNSNSSSK